MALSIALSGCSTIGIDRESVRPSADEPFERALVGYAIGDLDQAQVDLRAAIDSNPFDARATDLLRAILKEKGLVEEIGRLESPGLPNFAPQNPSDLVSLIRARSPAVREAIFGIVESRSALREANLDVGPELTLLTRFYPLGILARMTQSLYGGWWERKAKLHAAEAGMIEALANYGRVLEAVNRDALLAYIDAADAKAQIELINRESEILEDQHSQANILVKDGLSLPRVALAARDEIGSLLSSRALAEHQLAISTARLNALLNREPTEPIMFEPRGIRWVPPPTLDDAIAGAYANRFEIDEATARIKTAEAQHEYARRGSPNIDLYATYGESDEATESRFIKGFTVGAITRFPLAIIPLSRAREDRHHALVRQLQLREEQVRRDIATDVIDAYHRWEVARSGLEGERAGLAVAEEDRRVALAERDVELERNPMVLNRADIEFVRAQRSIIEHDFGIQRSLVLLGASVGADPSAMQFLDIETPGGISAPSANSITPGTLGRAVWVWRKSFLDSDSTLNNFIDLLKYRHIATVFLFVSESELIQRTDDLVKFLRIARNAGIAVHALNGEHRWTMPDQHVKALRYAEQVIAFNKLTVAGARFDAVHFDIEPHATDEWADLSRKEELLFAYVELLDKLKSVRNRIHTVIDVPIWFVDQEIEGIPVSDIVMRRSDGVAFMAYGIKPSRRSALVERIAGSPAPIPTPFWIGVSADSRHLCMGARPEEFEEEIHSIENSMNKHKQFAGVAIHELDRYRKLLLERTRADQPASHQCRHASGFATGSG